MKRWILFALMLLVFAMPAYAQSLPLVVDDAKLLTREAVSELSQETQRLFKAYSMDVVILTTQSLRGKTALDFAADYYNYNGYGQGEGHDGVMFMLSMEDRDWCVLTNGSGIRAFTNYGIDAITDDIDHYFSDGDYQGGFRWFLHDADIILQQAKNGEPFDTNNRVKLSTAFERTMGIVVPLLIASLSVAMIGLFILMIRMKTAPPQYSAVDYIKNGSMQISRAQDIYLYQTQTRVRILKNESSGTRGRSSTFR